MPYAAIGATPSPTPASRVIASDESTRATSSMAMQSVVKSAPDPPYSAGNGRPNRPSSPIDRTTSSGEHVLAVPPLCVRRDLLLREVADDLAERFVFLGEVEVHQVQVASGTL